MLKLDDVDTAERHFTRLSCKLLDVGTCRCSNYETRRDHVPDCISLDAASVRVLDWLPDTCAYRLVAEGRDLYWWHHLVSGDPSTVHQAGVSVRGHAVPETKVHEDDYWDYVVLTIETR